MRNSKLHGSTRRTRSSLSIILLVSLCCFFYALGAWQKSGTGRGDSIAQKITRETDCTTIMPNLYFETHHKKGSNSISNSNSNSNSNSLTQVRVFEPCEFKYTDYTPCFGTRFRERKCPDKREKLKCLVPAPNGYVIPFTWPKSREFVPFKNVPCTKNNLMHFEGGLCKFHDIGIEKYISALATVVPISDGTVRTALDIGSSVGSFGAYLLEKSILTLSLSPRDSSQVQFALERGVPAVIGGFGEMKLPYPSRAFDLLRCSNCFLNWTSNDGIYMMEVDRILRPGGYFILSNPSIKSRISPFQKSKQELDKIETISDTLCWKKKYEKGEIVIWQKSLDWSECGRKLIRVCGSDYSDDSWYKKMEPCITQSPNPISQTLKPFPERLFLIPPQLASNPEAFISDNKLWKKQMNYYKRINKLIGLGRYRNIMDMNANFGSFGANMEKGWVMNVVPSISERKNNLEVVFERGLIGIYHDWCEAFSTYPRTYDLIHASGLFTLYEHKCEIEEILLEMDRILRPEGAVIIRDNVDLLNKIKVITSGMRWKSKIFDHEDGPLVPEKILICVKEYWVGTGNNNVL